MSGTPPDDKKLLRVLLPSVLAVAALLAWAFYSERWHLGPVRCPPGAVALGPRCCGTGQSLEDRACSGTPELCPKGHLIVRGRSSGCIAKARRLVYRGGQIQLGINDWEAQGTVDPHVIDVGPFELDATEMTLQRWRACTHAGKCVPRPGSEPGLPVSGVTPGQAEQCCAFFGGRLPTGDEWLLAATGADQRRFPWGQTGLVCRRAAFGLVRGPCAEGAAGPDLVGVRPDGATPEGALDMAGNVAEWTREPDGSYRARGGSYRSRAPSELKSWSVEQPSGPAPHVGFRCAYDAPSHAHGKASLAVGAPRRRR
jgi:hypothetical protein